ncbi:PaaX family transcriptional regulator [Pseudonocardia sp. RS11V-5]|uniref:PaaX family transcriptional regulator n=1 Tax=Pseudonocardia terrae TaxID=2905831 RepID=UPI001E3C246E|nr:PaaX family transcriptional regulator C-terminal domain-containing protein [Pseudonocardia terrae]MCE3555814.1 PaaX family transcriptional regulator [Pseudonocardia terrae]
MQLRFSGRFNTTQAIPSATLALTVLQLPSSRPDGSVADSGSSVVVMRDPSSSTGAGQHRTHRNVSHFHFPTSMFRRTFLVYDHFMATPAQATTTLEPEVARARRPKWLTLMLLGHLTHEEPIAVSTGTFIEALSRLGVGSHAVRSTLSRLVDSGMLRRHRRGRETFYSLTPHGSRILRAGNAQAWRRADAGWDGTWTVLAYSIPEERRAERLRLRSRLAWGGFGLLRSGLWVAPGSVDVEPLVEGLDVLAELRVFTGTPAGRSADDLIEEAYDLEEIAARYRRFLTRWAEGAGDLPDELCELLVLRSEWQLLVQADPRLPLDHLPRPWPATAAEDVFRARYAALEGPAIRIGQEIAGQLETPPG